MNFKGANSVMIYRSATHSLFSLSEVPTRLEQSLSFRTNAEDPMTSRSCLRDLVRPVSVFLITLAAAVALWGFSYKLSLYETSRKHSSHVSVAKMWLGPERQLGLSGSPSTRASSGTASSTQVVLALGTTHPILGEQSRWSLSETVAASTARSFLFGSRSPPSRIQSMRSLAVA